MTDPTEDSGPVPEVPQPVEFFEIQGALIGVPREITHDREAIHRWYRGQLPATGAAIPSPEMPDPPADPTPPETEEN